MASDFLPEDHKIAMASKRRMTYENYGRLGITIIFFVAAAATGWNTKTDPGLLPIHIAFVVCSIGLLARTIYKYLKGE